MSEYLTDFYPDNEESSSKTKKRPYSTNEEKEAFRRAVQISTEGRAYLGISRIMPKSNQNPSEEKKKRKS